MCADLTISGMMFVLMAWTKAGPGRPKGTTDAVQRMTLQARTQLVWYLMTKQEYCPQTGANIAPGIKARADELMRASSAGDVKATRDILDRVAGRATQSLDVNVSDRKMIKDDTTPRLETGTQPTRVPHRVISPPSN